MDKKIPNVDNHTGSIYCLLRHKMKPVFLLVLFVCYQDFFIVEILKGTYKGQKPIRLVRINTAARMPRIIAAVPVILPFIYRIATTMANTILITRSIVPMFFFICFSFL
jgi:hypothetical protein